MFKKYVVDLKSEFQGYNSKKFMKDVLAGVTVSAVALPLALAFGVSSGADAAAGLITAILSGLIMSLLSGASYQISGPTGAMTAVLMTLVARFSIQGVFIAGFIAGVILLILGICKLGKLVNIIPLPVITGFTSGIAVLIALGQIDNFFGTTSTGSTQLEKLLSYFANGFNIDIQTTLIGLLVILIMIIWPKKWNEKVPSSLIGIIVAGLVSFAFSLDIPVVGDIPKTLFPENRLDIFSIDLEAITPLLSAGFTIAALGMIESLLCATSASRMKNEEFDADRELISQGIGNMIIPFFGGVPSTAAIARTSVAIKSGGETRLTGVFHSVFLLLCMFLLGPIMSRLPLAALAGVLMVTAWRMNEWESIKYGLSRRFKGAITKFTITMIATVVFDLTIAIVAGIFISMIIFVLNVSKTEMQASPVRNSKIKDSDIDIEGDFTDAIVVYITGPIFFGSCDNVIKELEKYSQKYNKIILSLRGVPTIDVTAISALRDFYLEKKKDHTKIMFCGVQYKVMENLQRSDLYEIVGHRNFYWSVDQLLLSEANKK